MILGICCSSANVLFWFVFFIDFSYGEPFRDVFFTDDYHVEVGDSNPPQEPPRRSSEKKLESDFGKSLGMAP